jgi:alkylated DNA repair protein alkB family protein 6
MEDSFVRESKGGPPTLADLKVPVANWSIVSGQDARSVLEEGGVLRRGVRYSLTCRDVEKVASVLSMNRR